MLRIARWKVALVGLALVLGVLFSLPNAFPAGRLPGWAPSQRLNLGLDFQGGSYLLLEVDLAAMRRERQANLVEDVRTQLRADRITFTGLAAAGPGVTVRISDPAQLDAAVRALNRLTAPAAAGVVPDLSVSRQADQRLSVTPSEGALRNAEQQAVTQSIEIIRRRVDALGTREPTILRQGVNRIVVQAPGESDPERLKNVIGQTARLTFHMVDDQVTPEQVATGRVPPGSMILPGEFGPEVVRRRVEVSGENLTNASLSFDQSNAPVVSLRFDSQGARRFAAVTRQDNVGKRFAIVLDERVISAPTIQEPIPGGSGQISGNFTQETANDLAVLLNAGALPAPLTVEEQRTVGAELGQDAIDAGRVSTVIAFLSVLAFMVLAYGFLFGGIAVVALIVNGLLVIAAMSVTQATLTLPGIAGLILTLAVAVDANVLIYERMREEVRAGRSAMAAADAGFARATVTILDANITTLAAALILFQFGAGPVRGFAWTLSIGVFTSVFTAVLITQVLLAWWFKLKRPKTLPIA